MRHQKHGVKLGRDTNARKALARSLASSLFEKGRLTTTQAKAKFARSYIEKLVTSAKKNSLATSRILASVLSNLAFTNLQSKIAPYFAQKSGGYTRIVKLGSRRGDAAPMARLELLEWNKIVRVDGGKQGKSVSKSRREKPATGQHTEEKKSATLAKASVSPVVAKS